MFRQKIASKTFWQQEDGQKPMDPGRMFQFLAALGPNAQAKVTDAIVRGNRMVSVRLSVGVLGNIMRGNLVVNGRTRWYYDEPITSMGVECKARFLSPEMPCDLISEHLVDRVDARVTTMASP